MKRMQPIATLLVLLLLSACSVNTGQPDAATLEEKTPGVDASELETAQTPEKAETPDAEETSQAPGLAFVPPESDGDYDLVFFFAATDIGDYEFSIAPEGSDDWQKLDEAHWLGTCGRSEEHSRVHQQPSHISKFGFRFDGETDGRYQLRTTTVGVTPAEVQQLWPSIEIKDQTTLIVVRSDPQTDKQLPELLPMRRCADCPQSWFFQEDAPAEAQPEVIDCCYVALPNDETASYFLAPEGCEDWIAVRAEASDGLCENEKIHGEGYRLLRVSLDADAAGTRYQLRREEGVVTATWHDICITDNHTLLRVYRQPMSTAWQSAWCAEEELLLVESFARCGECPESWPEGSRQECGTTALSANKNTPVGESACGDLEFYFGADNVGWYEFSIAPEGSNAWVKLDDVCLDRGWSADGYICLPKYGVRFEEGSGLYQLRATVKAPLPFAISNVWHNLPLPEGTLLYVACPPGAEQWQETIAATQAVIVTQMEPDGLRE